MELLNGDNGQDAAKQLHTDIGPLHFQRARHDRARMKYVAQQYCHAVANLHNRGVAHEDIKPENFMHHQMKLPNGQRQEQIKLIDYGMVTTVNHWGGGTPLYMPPEAGTSKYSALKHDAYSLGVTLLALKNGGDLNGPMSLKIRGREIPIHLVEKREAPSLNKHQLMMDPQRLSQATRGSHS